jgi:hypothetical protein
VVVASELLRLVVCSLAGPLLPELLEMSVERLPLSALPSILADSELSCADVRATQALIEALPPSASADASSAPFKITQGKDKQRIEVQWDPEAMGVRRVTVKYNGADVCCTQETTHAPSLGSFSVFVLAAHASARHSTVANVQPTPLTAGQATRFQILAFDGMGRPAVRGTDLFRASVTFVHNEGRRKRATSLSSRSSMSMSSMSMSAPNTPGVTPRSSALAADSPGTPSTPARQHAAGVSGRRVSARATVQYDERAGSFNQFTVTITPKKAGVYEADVWLLSDKVLDPSPP